MKKYEELELLTQTEKTIYLAKYLNKYIDKVKTKFTENKELVNKVINNNTIMLMIKIVVDTEQSDLNKLIDNLTAPFEITHYSTREYDSSSYNQILYDLLIKKL